VFLFCSLSKRCVKKKVCTNSLESQFVPLLPMIPLLFTSNELVLNLFKPWFLAAGQERFRTLTSSYYRGAQGDHSWYASNFDLVLQNLMLRMFHWHFVVFWANTFFLVLWCSFIWNALVLSQLVWVGGILVWFKLEFRYNLKQQFKWFCSPTFCLFHLSISTFNRVMFIILL